MKKIIVGKKSKCDFKSISEALAAAEDGDEIFVTKGTYKENFIIDKEISLIGEEKKLPIITIENGIVCTVNSNASIKNIHFQNTYTVSKDKSEYGVVCIYSDSSFENCEFSDSFDSGVLIDIDGIKPELKNCKFYGNRRNGLILGGNSEPVIENCEISDNEGHGIAVVGSGSPVIKNSKIFNNILNGIFFGAESHPIIENLEIFNNKGVGITVAGSAIPEVSNCKIYNNTKCGIYATENSAGTYTDCELYYYNSEEVVAIFKNCSAVFKNCNIHDFLKAGVTINNDANPEFENCEIHDCAKNSDAAFGFVFMHNSKGKYRNCKIHNIYGIGISVQKNSEPDVEDFEIYDCFKGIKSYGIGISFNHNSSGNYKNCKIHNIMGDGILSRDSSYPVVENCEIYDCMSISDLNSNLSRLNSLIGLAVLCPSGIDLKDNSAGTYRGCKIHNINGKGIVTCDEAHPVVVDCCIFELKNWGNASNDKSIEGFEGVGIDLCDSGCGSYVQCDIHNIEGFGIRLGSSINANFEDCNIYDIDGEEVLEVEQDS